jgi:membrane protease YdiL (CAAX protease family)
MSTGSNRLAAWQGAVVLVVVGLGAQIAGGVVLGITLGVLVAMGEASLSDLQTPSFAVVAPSLVVTGLVMALGSIAAAPIARRPVREAIGFRGAPWPAFVAAPIGILALGPTSDGLRRLMQHVAPNLTLGTLEGLEGIVHSAPLWVVAPLFAFIPGIAEEVLFRGAFQRSIRTRWLAIVLSGFFFALYHADPHHVAAVLPLGFYLAWLGDRAGSVWVPITAHVINNGTAVIASTLVVGAPEPTAEDLVWIPVGWAVAALAIFAVWWSTRRSAPVVEPMPALAGYVGTLDGDSDAT